jgi:hypothetical protein
MIPNRDILRAVLVERPVPALQVLTDKFYAACVAELQSSPLFECVFLDDDSTGSSFFSYFIFPRDHRSLRVSSGYYKGHYNGIGLAVYLCICHPLAAYGAISASTGPHSAGASWLLPETVQSLPSHDWSDVEQAVMDILRRHSIAILAREEAMKSLTSMGLPTPAESNISNDTDHVFFALFNNEY